MRPLVSALGVRWTMGPNGWRFFYIGTFVDAVKRYPHINDWIEVVW